MTTFSASRSVISLTLLTIMILMPLGTLRAQDPVTGAIEGYVVDSAKMPIAGALVQIISTDSGAILSKRTNAQGYYRQGLLPPGEYRIRASMPGYASPQDQLFTNYATRPNEVRPPIILTRETPAGATATPEPLPGAQQPVGTPTPAVQAQTAPPAGSAGAAQENIASEINLADARRSGVYTDKEVATLPLGSTTLTRTFDELGLLLPGVAPPPETPGTIAGPGVGPGVGSSGQFAVNGLRSRANNFTVDGSDNNDEDIGVRRQGFFALVPQAIESVKEFQIITLLAPAQFGRNIGAQVNAVSKSGGNQTHGTVFGFLNTSQLNARNPFDFVGANTRIPLQGRVLNPDRQTLGAGRNVFVDGVQRFETNNSGAEDSFTLGQGGFVIGGPMIRSDINNSGFPRKEGDHTSLFYFISAEGQLLNADKESSFAVPTVEERGVLRTGATGLFFDPLSPQTAPTSNAFPTNVVGDAVFSLFPFPNNPNGIYSRNTYTTVLPASAQGKIISGKIDGNFSAFNRPQQFVARYNYTDDWRDIPVTGGALFSTLRPNVKTQNFSTYLNTNLSGMNSARPILNQLRASYGRTRLRFDEVPDRTHLIPSDFARTLRPNQQGFLLNAPTLSNIILPGDTVVNYFPFRTTEEDLNEFFSGRLTPVGQVKISGFSPVGVDVFNFPQRRVNNTYQLADTVTMQFGKHSQHNLTFGTDLRRTELNSDLPRNARPLLTFNAVPNVTGIIPERRFFTGADFAAVGAPSGVFQALTTGLDSTLNLRYYQLDFFGQDEWRIRRNLHLSFGLRYEYNTVPKSANNEIERTFRGPFPGSIAGISQFVNGRTGIFDPDKNNFAPRVGFSWSPEIFKNRTTVLRAGAGIYFDQILGAVVSQSRNVFPLALNTNFAGGLVQQTGQFNLFTPGLAFFRCAGSTQFVPLIQNGTLNTLNPSVPIGCLTDVASANFPAGFPVTLPARRLSTPEAYQYSASVDQQIGHGMVFSAAYVGTQGRHLLRETTPNLGPNALIYVEDFFGQSFGEPAVFGQAGNPGSRYVRTGPFSGNVVGGRPVSNVGGVTIYTTDANSRYDALQLQLRGRLGLLGSNTQFQAAYTFSEVKDDVSDVFDLAGAPALPQNSLTFAGERADASFDARHRISWNYITDLSSWGKHNSFAHFLFNGLQVAGDGYFQTGQPYTVNTIFDMNLDGNLTDRLNTTTGIQLTGDRGHPIRLAPGVDSFTLLAPVGQDGRVPRNSFRAGSLWLTNTALVKNFLFGADAMKRLTFRMDIFNLFNRANYGIPDRVLESPGFGKSTYTVTPGRRIQFGLKFSF